MAFMRLFAIAQSDSIEGFIELCKILNYMTVKEAGEKWSIGSRMVILYRVATRILREQRNGQYAAAP